MWALLPLKNFAEAKSRLSSVLTPAQRSGLFQAMVNDVLTVLQSHPDIDNTLIVSDDPLAAQLARAYGADYLSESGLNASGLNQAVQAGVDELARRGIDEVMVIHGDLPLMSGAELSHLIHMHRQHSIVAAVGDACARIKPTLTISPDTRREGTNCLLCTPASSMTYCYGTNSFRLHAINASHIDMAFQVVCLQGVACDIDTAEDLLTLIARANSANALHAYHYITANGLTERLREVQAALATPFGRQYGGTQ